MYSLDKFDLICGFFINVFKLNGAYVFSVGICGEIITI